jgi:hypothetical protein
LVGVTLDREAEYTAQVDALGPGWRNAADDLGRNRTATTLRSMIEDFLHLFEHAQELPAKHIVEEVIAQEHCAQ